MSQRLKAAAVILVLGGAAGAAVPFLVDRPPPLSQLVATPITLSARPCIHHPAKSEPIGLLNTDFVTFRLPSICALSGCSLPPPIEALRAGQRLTIWREGTMVWQVQLGERMIYPFSEAVEARAASDRRSSVNFGALALLGVIVYAVARWRDAL